eukprot:ctg_177.g81
MAATTGKATANHAECADREYVRSPGASQPRGGAAGTEKRSPTPHPRSPQHPRHRAAQFRVRARVGRIRRAGAPRWRARPRSLSRSSTTHVQSSAHATTAGAEKLETGPAVWLLCQAGGGRRRPDELDALDVHHPGAAGHAVRGWRVSTGYDVPGGVSGTAAAVPLRAAAVSSQRLPVGHGVLVHSEREQGLEAEHIGQGHPAGHPRLDSGAQSSRPGV